MSGHDTAHYSVLKAIVFWTPESSDEERDMGNVPELTVTPQIEFLDHFSSRAGVRSKDASVPVEIGGEVSLTLDEMTAENIAMAFLGQISDQVEGDPGYDEGATRKKISVLAGNEIVGKLRVQGTNTVGKRVEAVFPRVSFKGGNAFSFISDEWASMQLTGELLYSDEEESYGNIFEMN